MKALDYTNKRVGKLLVIEPTTKLTKHGYKIWKCKCDCGTMCEIPTSALRMNYISSCGCTKYLNIIGKRFGELTALELTDKRSNGSIIWKCVCSCGNTRYAPVSELVRSRITSCGCANKNRKYKNQLESAIIQYFNRYQQGATVRNLTFELTLDQFIYLIKLPCYYCGTTINTTRLAGTNKLLRANGVDRLNSSIGYLYDNCVAACKNCNIAKQKLNSDEFINLCRRIVRLHGL